MLDIAAMQFKHNFFLVVLCLYWTTATFECALTTFPASQAVPSGSSITLDCSGQPTDPYDWFYSGVNSPAEELIVNSSQVSPGYEDMYTTEVTGDGGCRLIVPNADLQIAGTYTCRHGSDEGSAEVVMLGSNPICLYGPMDLVDGDNVSLNCYVAYNGSMAPSMEWRSDTGQLLTNSDLTIGPYEVSSKLTIPVSVPSVSGFTCRTFFERTFDYSYTWTLPTVYIQYPTEKANITVRGNSYCGEYFAPDTTLTCLAVGYPAPTFTWTNVDTGETYNGSVLTLVNVGMNHWVCEASNSIRDVVYTSTAEEHVNVSDVSHVTLIQKNDGTGLHKDWDTFKYGFADGVLFWIGNECLHKMVSHGKYKLRFDMKAINDSKWYWAEYEDFSLGSETTNYVLEYSSFNQHSTAAADSLAFHKGMQFSTFDRDNDVHSTLNCADDRHGGFWFKDCDFVGVTVRGNQFVWDNLPPGRGLRESEMWLVYTP